MKLDIYLASGDDLATAADGKHGDAWRHLLDRDDRERLARYRHHGAAGEFLTARAMLRTVLARRLDREPHSFALVKNKWGRPFLAPTMPGAETVRFNISHTRGLVALAITDDGDAGVDVEWIQRRTRVDEIADRYFAPAEVAALQALPTLEERTDRFFTYWTLKEAYIKCRGRGLAIPLADFAYRVDGSSLALTTAPGLDPRPAHDYALRLWGVGKAHRLALCAAPARGMRCSLRLTRLRSLELVEEPATAEVLGRSS